MQQGHDRIEDLARRRLRSLRLARGWTLDELAKRSSISASTISRIETGHRRLAIDSLAELAGALETSIDEILATDDHADVVIRPMRSTADGVTHWPLSRRHEADGRIVTKMRLPARAKPKDPRVHPGHDWFYVLEGTARLVLGDREHLVREGEAAEFDTMTPHAISGYGGPVEIVTIFDRHGEQAHLRPQSPA